jgi:hypothetical protein
MLSTTPSRADGNLKCLDQNEQHAIAQTLKDSAVLEKNFNDQQVALKQCWERQVEPPAFYQQKSFLIPSWLLAIAAGFVIGKQWP